jgi:hypothetical protein
MYPFYIPSIYRQDSEFLINLRDIKPELKYYIIIAKHQYENYAKNFNPSHLVILPDDIIKISDIRQFILELAIKNEEDKIWMSDDDLLKFFLRYQSREPDTKYLKQVDFTTFITEAETKIQEIQKVDEDIVQIGFKYSTFAIPKKDFTINTNIGMIQFLDIQKIKENENIKYDTSFNTLEDTDFTITLFNNNFKNCQLNNFIFTAPKSGKGKGGLEKEYQNGAKGKGITQFMHKYNIHKDELIKIIDISKDKYRINWNNYKNKELENKLNNNTLLMLENNQSV